MGMPNTASSSGNSTSSSLVAKEADPWLKVAVAYQRTWQQDAWANWTGHTCPVK